MRKTALPALVRRRRRDDFVEIGRVHLTAAAEVAAGKLVGDARFGYRLLGFAVGHRDIHRERNDNRPAGRRKHKRDDRTQQENRSHHERDFLEIKPHLHAGHERIFRAAQFPADGVGVQMTPLPGERRPLHARQVNRLALLLPARFTRLAGMIAVTTEQMRQLDKRTIAAGTPGAELMERAGYAVAKTTVEFLKRRDSRSALLFAGKGNNGGDAIVAARHLAAAGCHTALVLLCKRDELQGDPLLHFQRLVGGIHVFELPNVEEMQQIVAETEPTVVVDGLLGTGLKGELREPYDAAIKFINSLKLPVVAIDIPSGLDSDTGEVHGLCVRADVTVTMGLPKIGLLKPAATDVVGRIEVADIGFVQEFVEEIRSDFELLTAADVSSLLPRRHRSAHKGEFGHLLVIAGTEGYTGAAVMTAHAAARTGAGLVTLLVPRAIYPIVAAGCPPEVMPRPIDDYEKVGPTFFSGFDAVAIGPGLGQRPEVQKFVWRLVTSTPVPMVVDADALNALAQGVTALKKVPAPLVLTPHPGEMGRLIGKSAKEVEANRWEMAREFAQEHGVVTVLKGAGTVIADRSGTLWINSTGNPGMAKGGMGDALTGIIGALLAQGVLPVDAARAGVFVHGMAGDIACDKYGERSMLASDLILSLGAAFERLT